MTLSFSVDTEAKHFADSHEALFFETSAKSGKNIRAVFDDISMSARFFCFLFKCAFSFILCLSYVDFCRIFRLFTDDFIGICSVKAVFRAV